MLIQKFCGAHYRRRVPYVPMLVPTMSIEQMGCIIHIFNWSYSPTSNLCEDWH